MFAFLSILTVPGAASAKAPPHATTILPAEVVAAPELDAPVLASVPRDTQLTLTGAAAPGYLQVDYDGEPAWVPAQLVTTGVRPGIDTAVAIDDVPLLDAPMAESTVLGIVPAGETVILTGATLDGYDAASHNGVGGWVEERGLAR